MPGMSTTSHRGSTHVISRLSSRENHVSAYTRKSSDAFAAPGGGNAVRVAMIAYTLYAMDPSVQRAARALAEAGHQVDVFAVAYGAATEVNQCGVLPRVRLLHM